MGLAGSRRPDEQQPGLREVGILASVAAHREHYAGELRAIHGVVGGENEIIDRCVLIERRNVGAIQHALLAAFTSALAPLRAGDSFPLQNLPSRAAALFANFYH